MLIIGSCLFWMETSIRTRQQAASGALAWPTKPWMLGATLLSAHVVTKRAVRLWPKPLVKLVRSKTPVGWKDSVEIFLMTSIMLNRKS